MRAVRRGLSAAERLISDSKPRLFLAVFVPLVVVYAATAWWTTPYHGDALTNVVTAWYLGSTGSPIATEHHAVAVPEQRGNFVWIVDSPRGPVAQYPPGAALVAAPLYGIVRAPLEPTIQVGSNRPDLPPVDFPMPPVWPGTLVAVLTTAAAMGLLALIFAHLGGPVESLVGGVLMGLGTSAWSVASDMFWQHGPAMMWVALGVWLFARERALWAGAAFAMAILTRPHLAVIPMSLGAVSSLKLRSVKPALSLGSVSVLGLVALLWYNWWLLGRITISGAYGSDFQDNLVGGDLGWFAGNVVSGLFDQRRGLLIWTPALFVVLPFLPSARKAAPTWASSAALGGLMYLLIQYRANRFSGGEGHFSYRYPLEALVAMAPLAFVAYRERIRVNARLTKIFAVAASASILIHGVGAALWPSILIE